MLERLEQIKYINHRGDEINFGQNGLYVNENDLHNFAWTVEQTNGIISGFSRGTQTKKIPVRIACASESEGVMRRNYLFEVPELDVLSNQYGKLVINGYYCECYITASSKKKYYISGKYMEIDLTVTTDRPFWVKETKVNILSDPEWQPTGMGSLDFPFDFPFDYVGETTREKEISNESIYDTNFRMVIHGTAVNPTVMINNHEYQVNATVLNGKVLVIDSIAKTVKISDEDGGNEENVFNMRNRDYYIFQPIPSGELSVIWDNTFTVDLYLLEERSEPKWVM